VKGERIKVKGERIKDKGERKKDGPTAHGSRHRAGTEGQKVFRIRKWECGSGKR
jgi:hypothetical protein